MSQLYREHILDHYQNPRNQGSLSNPTVQVDEANPLCGDILHFDVQVTDGVIGDIKFSGHGCAISLAAASILTDEIKGKKVDELPTDQEMQDLLGVELSPVRLKCGLLALSGVRKAVQ